MRFDARFAVMARVAEALKVGHIELRAASIDRNDMIDDLCERGDNPSLALLAERTLLQFQITELPPCGRLIKFKHPSCTPRSGCHRRCTVFLSVGIIVNTFQR